MTAYLRRERHGLGLPRVAAVLGAGRGAGEPAVGGSDTQWKISSKMPVEPEDPGWLPSTVGSMRVRDGGAMMSAARRYRALGL